MAIYPSDHWVMQDANYNVLGLVDRNGKLVERYEYSPYGERKVFVSAGANDPGCYAPTLVSGRRTMYTWTGQWNSVPVSVPDQPFGLSEFGHQGLLHEEEIDNGRLIQNRHRVLHAGLGRFLQRDPLGYVDAMSLYQYVLSNPSMNQDVQGLCEQKKKSSEPSGFVDSLRHSWNSIQGTYTSLILEHYYGLPGEAQKVMDEAYESGPLGQTKNSSDFYYYGTRGALGVATASVAAATGVIAWEAAGGATWGVGIGTGNPAHIIYGAAEGGEAMTWMHAVGGSGEMWSIGAGTEVVEGAWVTMEGIPILSAEGALNVGTTSSCLNAALQSLVGGILGP